MLVVGRSERHAVHKHCADLKIDPQGDEANAVLRGLQQACLKPHAIGSEAVVRRAITREPPHPAAEHRPDEMMQPSLLHLAHQKPFEQVGLVGVVASCSSEAF